MPLLALFQDASSSANAAIWIPIAAQAIIAIVGWIVVWRIARSPVQVIVLAPQPEENAKKTTSRKESDTPADLRLKKALPFLLPIPVIEIFLQALDLYGLFTSAEPLGKAHLLLAVNATFWTCNFTGMLIWLLHLIRTDRLNPAAKQLEGHDPAADIPTPNAVEPPAEVVSPPKK